MEVPEDTNRGLRLWLQPFGPQINSYTMGTVMFRFSKQELERCIYTRKFERPTMPMPAAAAAQKGPVTYRVLYDGVGKHVVVLRNGVRLGDWKLNEESDGAKVENERDVSITAICFDSDNDLKLNRMRMQPWDGVILEKAAPPIGKVESISSEGVVFSGERKKRETGTFLQLHEPLASLSEADSMVVFGSQGELSVAGLEVKNGRARGQTNFSKTMDLPAAAIQNISFPVQPTPPEKVMDTLIFQNGNELRGTLLGANSEDGLRWKMAAGQELTFRAERIAGVRLASREGAAADGGNSATIELRNGDRLRGELTGLDEKQVQFLHPLLGPVRVARDRVADLYPNPAFSVIEGGRDPAAWVASRRGGRGAPPKGNPSSWMMLEGYFISRKVGFNDGNGEWPVLAAQGEIPDKFELRLDATDRNGNLVNFGVSLGAKDGRASLQTNFSYYNLSLSMSRTKPPGRSSSSYKNVSLRSKVPDAGSRLALRLFVDRTAGCAWIYLNGAQVARVGQAANEEMPGIGEVITLDPGQQEDSTSIFSNIWIGPWNGDLPRGEPEGNVALTNGDAVPGVPSKLQDGKVAIETAIGNFELPLEKVQFIDFGGKLEPEKAVARLRLADGSSFNVDTYRWTAQELTAHSSVIGGVRLPANAVTELVFNPTPVRAPLGPSSKDAAATKGKEDAEGNAAEALEVFDR
jgi:hypothetical protein